MKKLLFYPLYIATVFFVLAACTPQQEATEQAEEINEERFQNDDDMSDIAEEITEVYGVNHMILEIAKKAEQIGGLDQALMDFNNKAVSDHQSIQEQLKQLANQYNMALPENITYDEQSKVGKLASLEGTEFAKEYAETMEDASEDMERLLINLEDELEGNAEDITAFVQKTIPLVKEHENIVDEMDENM